VSAVLVVEVDMFTTTLVLLVSADEVEAGVTALFCWSKTVFVVVAGWWSEEGRICDCWVPDVPVAVTMTQGLDAEVDG